MFLVSGKRRRFADEVSSDPHTSVYRSQQPIEVRTLKTSVESAEAKEAKPLNRFGFQGIKQQLKNNLDGPLYQH